jgi:hypothetical protein
MLPGFNIQAQAPFDAVETDKLRNFLLQESAEPGVRNYQQLGIESMNGIEWGAVPGLRWNPHTYLLESINWSNKKLSGNLNLSDFLYLQEIYCTYNEIKSLNTTGAVSLKYLNVFENDIEAVDVTTSPKLTFLRVTYNKIRQIDLSNNPELTFLCCTGNEVESLDFSNNNKMETIYAIENQLSYLNVQNCPRVKELLCSGNNLTELDVSNKARLTDFTCGRNSLLTLNVTNCPVLDSIVCSSNRLDTLDLTGCLALRTVNCEDNSLKALYLDDCLLLETLLCSDNQLDSLRLPESPSMKTLNCRGNNMDFHTLPPILPSYTEYLYFPQHSRTAEAAVDSADFSYYYEVDGYLSHYTWNRGVHWLHPEIRENGVFIFDESYLGTELICRIENDLFPRLVLRYDVTMKSREDLANSNPNPGAVPAGSVHAGMGFVHVAAASPVDVGIYSMNGACVYAKRVGEGRTDIPLPPGMYVATVSGKAGRILRVR